MFNLFKKKENEQPLQDSSEELRAKINGHPIIKEQHSGVFTEDGVEIDYYNEDTLHGLHYTEEEFYAEAERRYNDYCTSYPHLAKDAEKVTYVMNTFRDWNNHPDEQRTSHFMELYRKKISGYKTVASAADIPQTPEWQQVHGISLVDYAQAAGLLQKNITDQEICKALGIEKPIWDEVYLTWNNRFVANNGANMEIFDAYMRFQTQEIHNPGLKALAAASLPASGYVQQLMTDDYFWTEINAIMLAGSRYGIDTMQYVFDKYQINVGDYSASCMAFAERNPGTMPAELYNYQEQKTKEYEVIFAKQMGGNISDDVEF